MALVCPNPECGNRTNFLVKVVQAHVVTLENSHVEVVEEGRPSVLEVLCDLCDTEINFEEAEEALRKEVLLTIGAR